MRLKRLKLKGFKSFADEAVLEFNSPIVSIVGANGSGKSNVVEAIRFVVGVQSPKALRADNLSDVVFNGNGLKLNRGEVVLEFCNKDRVFRLETTDGNKVDLDFDEVSVAREVFRDGGSRYYINGGPVRLKDIGGLLASVNMGAGAHNIISQGDTGRMLLANGIERRDMIEEALGLKIYRYRLKSVGKKIEETERNLADIEMRRNALLPRLGELKRLIEKIERARALKKELIDLYSEYFALEGFYISRGRDMLFKRKIEKEKMVKLVQDKIDALLANKIDTSEVDAIKAEMEKVNQMISEVDNEMAELNRYLGRLEGERGQIEGSEKESVVVPVKVMEEFLDGVVDVVVNGGDIEGYVSEFRDKYVYAGEAGKERLEEIDKEVAGVVDKLNVLSDKRGELLGVIDELKQRLKGVGGEIRDRDKALMTLSTSLGELKNSIESIDEALSELKDRGVRVNEMMRQAKELVGVSEFEYREVPTELVNVEDVRLIENKLSALSREIEGKKAVLAVTDVSGIGDVMNEYEELSKKYEFMSRELDDMKKTLDDLKYMADELMSKIADEFSEGVEVINSKFSELVSFMFGGGGARIVLNGDGLDVEVDLPNKNIVNLNMLSGGEKALVSVSLLFALSMISPPPFLVLDEADAALDEVNSRAYGDMIEKLSETTQLIVVTHNRETMLRSGGIYGVTMDKRGGSRVYYVGLDEAVNRLE